MAQGKFEMFCEHCDEAHPASDEMASGIPLSDQAEIDLEDLATLA